MIEKRVTLRYQARPWQAKVHALLKRFSVLVVHRRGGKTVLAVNTLINAAITTKKTMARYGYVAPQLKQARQLAWDYLRHFTEGFPGVEYHESLLQVRFPNGARIQVFGADNPDALRGMFFDGCVLDEFAQMRPQVWGEIIRPMLSDRLGWALIIGTPYGVNAFSERYFHALSDPLWYAELLTYKDTNALLESEVEQARNEMSAAEFAQEYLCDFAATTSDALISVDKVREAMARKIEDEVYYYAPRVLGVDVARMGGDRSVIACRQGLAGVQHYTYRDLNAMELASQVALRATEWGPEQIFIDIGYSPGVFDRVVDLGFPAVGVNFGGRADDARFQNKRAEMWWRLAEWIGGGAAIPNDNELLRDLTAIKYKFANVNNKIQLESKDQLKERGMPSPDLGDAWALTFAYPVPVTAQAILPGMHTKQNQYEHEYDHLAGV